MSQEVFPRALHRCAVDDAELILVAGDLLTLDVQGVACYSSTSLTLHSAAAVRIVEQGGRVVRADAAKHLPARVGDALILSAGRLPMRYVLVAVISELRTAPTLDSVRAAIQVVLERAAAVELDSLTLPLLRVRRRLDDDDLLVVTLVTVLAHLSGATTLRRVLLLLNEEEEPARLAVQRIAPLLDTLSQVGRLRARAQAFSQAYEGARRLTTHQQPHLAHELLLQRFQTLTQVVHLLETATQLDHVPGRAGLWTEVRACQAELDQLALMLDGTVEREVGS